jgi:betaine-aldehyde dehydrogenase
MLIGGQIVAAKGGATYNSYSPSSGELPASVPFAQLEDVNVAVEFG